MNVKELRDKLAELSDDLEVIVSSDEEGNSYERLSVVADNLVFIDEGYGRGDIMVKSLDDDDRSAGYTEEDTYGYVLYEDDEGNEEWRYEPDGSGVDCVVLYP